VKDMSRPSSLPLEKNLILIAALEGRLIFRDNSPLCDRILLFPRATPPSTKKERTSGPGGPEQ